MGVSVVYGRMLLRYGAGEKSRAYLRSYESDNRFPFIRPEMFSAGSEGQPFFYDQQVIAFAATYKNVEYDSWEEFIRKFEAILEHLEFENVHLHLQTELMGSFHFYWKNISAPDTLAAVFQDADYQLIRTENWYFGFGQRDASGALSRPLRQEDIYDLDHFRYPPPGQE